MFLFIFESIGTSELILIAGVALVVFGPRKLPQLAKTIGKTMAEFRSATNEFKSTWEKEVAFEDESLNKEPVSLWNKNSSAASNTISRNFVELSSGDESLPPPQIKEISAADFPPGLKIAEMNLSQNPTEENKSEKPISDKRDWL